MELWVGAVNLGFLYAFVAIGVYITFRIHDFPDITVDGTFATGAAVTAVLVVSGTHPLLAMAASFVICSVAGSITALINTRLNVNSLLAGILVMTGLYSINLHIMGRSNIPLLDTAEFFTFIGTVNPGMPHELWISLCLTLIMAAVWFLVSFFFKTDFGLSMRASGNNPVMARAAGINVDRVKVLGVAMANGLVGLSGSLVAQYQGFSDIGMGIGTVVAGLASVIIGESISRKHSIYVWIASAIFGSIIFRFMIAIALYAGMNPIDLKLLTAIFVLITLVVTAKISKGVHGIKKKQLITIAVAALVMVGVSTGIVKNMNFAGMMPQKKVVIGVFQVSDNPILSITRDAFLDEMKRLGYVEGKNATFLVENANGDLATVTTIVDKFLRAKVDVAVPISTACTQAAIGKIKDRPVVFAAVANPFIIGAGKSDTEHLRNVTGVYGTVPMDRMMEIVRKILPGPLRIGAIWDPSQANSEANVKELKKALEHHPDVTFVGGNITNSSEVHQVAASLVQKNIDAFVLPVDNIVYSTFESVVRAARSKKVPIFFSDVDHLENSLVVFGYPYEATGRQAAGLVSRVLKGEEPASIPFENYRETVLGINLRAAKQLDLTIPRELLDKANVVIDEKGNKEKRSQGSAEAKPTGKGKRLALFKFSDNVILDSCAGGVIDGLKKSGVLEKEQITIDHKSSHGDIPTAQSIAQEMVSRNYDYIVTVSTISLQVTVKHNKKIPHVFAAVTDPIKAGAAKSLTDHPPNMTGLATPQPVESTVKLMRRVFPKAKVIGMIWNPAEMNSEICTLLTREAAKKYGFKVVEVQITGTQEIEEALKSVLGSAPDIFFTSCDATVSSVIPSVARKLRQKKIPYFTNTPADIDSGTFMCLGADYYDVGLKAADMAIRIIKGEKPADMPIISYVPEQLTINLALAKEYGITISDDLMKKAARVVK